MFKVGDWSSISRDVANIFIYFYISNKIVEILQAKEEDVVFLILPDSLFLEGGANSKAKW